MPSATALGSIAEVNVLAEIQKKIRLDGAITFAEFMEIALYSPRGYYEQQKKIGREGDFYTSISVGPLFGELLARRFADWLEPLDQCEIVEAGAHDGRFARDVLNWLSQNRPGLFNRLRYTIVEPSDERRSWQQTTLAGFSDRVDWIHDLRLLPGFEGIVFSNELLDAMAVHRIFWDAPRRQWMEWRVGLGDEKLVWVQHEISPECREYLPRLPQDLADVLPNKFTTEISPAASNWWSETAKKLRKGKLVAIDYGLLADEFFRPDRSNGTARGYYKHALVDDLLANPGEQDLTAHVDWTVIQRAGEQAGLRTIQFCSQEKFLMEIVGKAAAENWSAEQIRQLKTLTHPHFLGRAFRVLVQQRD